MSSDPEYSEEHTEENQDKDKKFSHFESIIGKIHHFYISEVIGPPKDYIELIHLIRTAQPFDTIYIYLNTRGGQLSTGAQLIPVLNSSCANIVTVAEGEVCSLGTMIFLAGKEMVIQDHTIFMIHNHSGFVGGKGHEYIAEATAISKWFEGIARDSYLGFLTEDEFDRMIKGEDFWFTAENARKRLNKYVKYLEKKERALEKKEAPKKKVKEEKEEESEQPEEKETGEKNSGEST